MLYYILFSIFALIFITAMWPKQCIKYILEPLLMDCDSSHSCCDDQPIKPFSNTLIVLGYNCIYVYSCLQIKCYKISIIVMPYITRLITILMHYNWLNQSFDNKLSIIHFYHNNVINAEALIEINNNTESFNVTPPLTYDYIICMDKTFVNPVNIMCYNKVPNNLLYELSNVRFLSIKIICNNKTYNVVLKTDDYNYYVVNNVIDVQFIQYYITHVLKELTYFEDFKYSLELLDNDINILSLNQTHKIIIKKDTYEIINETPNDIQTSSTPVP